MILREAGRGQFYGEDDFCMACSDKRRTQQFEQACLVDAVSHVVSGLVSSLYISLSGCC